MRDGLIKLFGLVLYVLVVVWLLISPDRAA